MKHWGKGLLAPAIAVAALLAPWSARADSPAPVLSAVGESGGYLTASWTLGPGTEADFIEAATSSETYPEGNFLADNTTLVDFLDPGQTSYTSPLRLDPGVYYVHVAAYDPLCQAVMCLDVFSPALVVTVGSGAPPTPVGPASSVAPPDRTTAFARLAVASRQRARRLAVEAAMPESGTITVGGTVSIPGAAKVLRLKAVSVRTAAGKAVRIRVKLSRRALRAAKRALARHRRVRANLTITARDDAGNTKTDKRVVRLRQ